LRRRTLRPETAARSLPSRGRPAALRETAAGGDAKALFEIGSLRKPRGVKQDMAAAANGTKQPNSASDRRVPDRQFLRRASASRDIKVETWYQLAAEQGASAMHNLAVLLAMAADGVTDNESAAHWFRRQPTSASRTASSIGILAAEGCRHEAEPPDLQMVRTRRQDRRQGRGAKRDQIANALRPNSWSAPVAPSCGSRALDPGGQFADIPEIIGRKARPNYAGHRHEEGRPEHPALILNKNSYDAGGANVIG
jgi:localization factor PodJL